jgi:hypothetical protein
MERHGRGEHRMGGAVLSAANVWHELGPVQVVAERLSALYPDELSLRRLLALAQVDASRVPFDGRAANMGWFAAVEAARQGRLRRLVEVMLEEYALDPWLLMVYSGLVKGPAGSSPLSPGEEQR